MRQYDECHSYLSHLQSEHHRLELLSRNIANEWERSNDQDWIEGDRAAIAARLSALQSELYRHFETEELGGFIDEAVSRRPSLSTEAREIRELGEQLRKHLLDVMRVIELGDRAASSDTFRTFAIELRRYQRREERLLEQGMNVYRREH